MVQPQSAPAPKKGMSIWAWVAIGCVGLLVLGGVAVGGAFWWGARKVKSIAQEMQDNPSMATAKMITALNPDLEMVSSDEAAGKVTIRNTKTNQTVTVSLADIQAGKISFDTPEGQTTMNFDPQAGKMEVRGANGEVATFGAAKLPEWVPAYPGAVAEGVYASEDGTQAGGTFGLTSADSVDQVVAFYKEQLEGAGFKVNETKYSGTGGSGGMVTGESNDGKRTVTFTVATDNGRTRVAGVYSEKKG